MGQTIQANPGVAPPEARWGRFAGMGPTYGALIALILLVLGNAIFTSNFATASNLWNVLLHRGIGIAIPVALLVVIVVGMINGALVAYVRVQPIVVTLATLIAGRGL